MNIDEMTVGQIREIKSMFCETGDQKNHPYTVGNSYFIRTVTHYYTGRLEWVFDCSLVLSDAAWIADTGRFNEFLRTGEPSEVEPYPDTMHPIISRSSIVDASPWPHDLPRDVK
jgi:hypothetical protein